MLKEYLIAIILGSLLGFGITGGYYSLKSPKNNPPSSSNPISPTTVPVDSDSQNQSDSNPDNQTQNPLIIETPQNYSIVENSKIEVQGSCLPDSVIVISTPVDSYVSATDESGNFQLKIDLESGFNIVQIAAIDPQDNQSEAELIITYSTAEI